MSGNDITPKMRKAAEHVLAMHRQELGFMPETDDPGMMSACRAWARRGALEAVDGMRHQDTGREGLGFRLRPEWVERFEQIEREDVARRGIDLYGKAP